MPFSQLIPLLLENFGALIYNEGLHFHRGGERQYAIKMRQRLDQMEAGAVKQLSARSAPPIVMFKETSAQHFFSFSGDGQWESFRDESAQSCWANGTKDPTPDLFTGRCNPRLIVRTCAASPNASDWRNMVVKEIMSERNHTHVSLLRWFRYTLPRWDLHEDQRNISISGTPIELLCKTPRGCTRIPEVRGGQDCTHYIYTPFLYEPLWDELARAISRRWGPKVNSVANEVD